MRKVSLLLLLFAAFGVAYGQGVPEILYYKFDGTGTTVPNMASNAPTGTANATIQGNLTQGSTGLCGGALIGTGSSSTSNFLNTGWNTRKTGDWTLSFWSTNVQQTTSLFYIFGDNTAGSFRCFTGGVAGSGNWILRGPVSDVLVNGAASTQPTMTTFVYSQSAGNVRAYVNGVLVNTVSQSTVTLNGNGPFKVGGYSGSTGMPNNMRMDEFRFYDRALDAAEILLTYNQCLPLSSAPDDAGVRGLNEPQDFCPDTLDVKVTITNAGTEQLDSCMVNWSVDGVAQTPVNFQGVLDTLNGTGPTDTMITLGSWVFAPNQPYDFKIWTSMPNGMADTVNFNDTLDVTLQSSIQGTFNIGGPNADYPSFSDAVDDLNDFGVCGPVIFNVHDSLFTEQIELDEVAGASAVNTITFRGAPGAKATTILRFQATTTSNNYTVRLNGADWLRFENMTLRNDGFSYGRVVEVQSGSDNNIFDNLWIVGDTTPTTTSTFMAVIHGPSGSSDDNNTFSNCDIRGGSYSIYWWGTGQTDLDSALHFTNNRLTKFYYRPMYLYYQDAPQVDHNYFDASASIYTGSMYRIFAVYCDNAFSFSNNQMIGGNKYGFGIYLSNCDGSANARGVVANNMITVGSNASTATSYGLYVINSGYIDFVHNNVNLMSNGNSSRAFFASGGGAMRMFNNNLVNNGPGYAAYISSAFSVSNMDNNNLYCPNGRTGFFSGNQASLADWQNASGFDANSVSVDPNYYSMEDLHTCNDTLDGAGTPYAAITTDFDGDMRDPNAPDIGADEFTPLTPNFLGSNRDLCTGDTILLVAGGVGDTVVWSTGATTRELAVTGPGTYSVVVNGVCGSGTDTIVVSQSALVYNNFLMTDTNEVCSGDTITLSSTQMADTYAWSNGGSGQSIQVTSSGTYNLTITDGCGTGTESVSVSFIETPTASFTDSTVFLTCAFTNTSTNGGGNNTYLWNFGDGNTSTMMNPIHIYQQSGMYNVTLIVQNECGSDSAVGTCNVTIVGATEPEALGLSVYPNPAHNVVNIAGELTGVQSFQVTVFTPQGQVVLTEDYGQVSGAMKETLDVHTLSKGVYFLQMEVDGQRLLKRLVIQ